ncbi:tonsoku-like protein isoform X1 [Lepeophtheirus salmonis]|uniref:tonsoku-like protein isoform X1 n=1 Tax=Lepeophtheirus salmonis TaxID=72036 RepID=UPI001AE267AD|nr:tonsoku-like protein isoform X1 [Lepeophtheirus salmonis]
MPSIKKLRRLKEKGAGSEESERDLVLQLGQELLSEGRFEEALVEFEELEELSKEKNHELHTFACRKAGETLEKLNNYEEAFKKIQKYHDLSVGDPIEYQRALTTLGGHFLSKSEYLVYDIESQFTFDSPEICDYLIKADDYCRRAENSIQDVLDPNVSNKEKEEMRSAIYANRFQIYYLHKRFESSEDFFHKAEKIMLSYKFWDRLISLYEIRSTLEHKSGKLENALLYIDQAMKVTGFNSRKEFILRDKAIILVDLRSFDKAQHVLIDAYKSANRDFRDSIKSILKCVCKILTILDQNENVYEVKKLEHLGDICVSVYAYHAALWYYDTAVNRLDPESEDDRAVLSGLYTSLAMTYKDLKMFNLASDFYMKELHLTKDVPEEAFKTLMALTITTELEGKSYKAIKSLFMEARSLAKNSGNLLRELHCLNEFIQFNERRKEEDSDVTEIKGKFEDLMNENSLTPEDITEAVEEKNEEEEEEDEFDIDDLIYRIDCNNKRAKRKGSLKKDLKGETELHRKVKVPGNEREVARLIAQSGCVDIEDNANFTPLHEACNHGQLEYVRMLVSAGADVNKESRKGTSPLISAALNGYVDIIEYLLDEGAKPYHQDNDGWSCLDHLKMTDSDSEDVHFKKLCSRLSRAIQTKVASGLRLDPKREESSGLIIVCQDSDEEDAPRNNYSSFNKQHSSLRSMKVNEKITKYGERNSVMTNEFSKRNHKEIFSSRGATDYRKAIASLGCSGASGSGSIINPSSSSVMSKAEKIYSKNVISEKEYKFVNSLDKDEWLEEDITPKRKKINHRGDEPIPKKSRQVENNGFFTRKKLVDKTERSSHFLPSSTLSRTSGSSSSSSSLNKPLPTSVPPHFNCAVKPLHQSTISNSIMSSMKNLEVRKVKVKVYEKMFLIPIPNKNLNAEWLANEASKRYHSSTGQRLLLKLTTEDGAEIYAEDPLCSIIGPNMEQFIAVTTQLNSSISLEKFYAKRCKELNRNRHKPLLDALISAINTGSFSLPEKIPFHMDDLEPILETLNYGMSSKLKELSIPYNHLSTLNFQSAFFSLTGLKKLNLSKCELQGHHLKDSLPQLPILKELDVSYNDLGDEALNEALDQFSSVTALNINKCGLSKDFELPSSIRDNLVKLSISGNTLSRHGIEEIVRSLNPSVLHYLDISYCGSFESIEKLLVLLSKGQSQECPLEYLDVSGLDLKGTICSPNVLDRFTHLKSLKLSGNMNITMNSLQKLLEGLYIHNIPLEALEAVDIFSLFSDEDPNEHLGLVKIFERLVSNKSLKCLKLHMEEEDYLDSLVQDLSKIWRNNHGPNSKVELKNQVLTLETINSL